MYLFPTSLCGVLVFDSLSRASSRPPPPPPAASLTHTTQHTYQHTHTPHTHTQTHTQHTHTTTQLTHTFAWQAWHSQTSTFVLRGRRGTNSHPPSFCVAGMALMALGWRAWTGLVARDARDAAALCVAGVAQTHIHRRFAWQAWHNLTATVVLRGRRGNSWHWVARLDWLGRP